MIRSYFHFGVSSSLDAASAAIAYNDYIIAMLICISMHEVASTWFHLDEKPVLVQYNIASKRLKGAPSVLACFVDRLCDGVDLCWFYMSMLDLVVLMHVFVHGTYPLKSQLMRKL